MSNIHQKEKENFKERIRERLRRYTFETPEDEIDVREMEALVSLLDVLEKGDKKTDHGREEAYGQFEAYKALWEADEKRLNVMPDNRVSENERAEEKKPEHSALENKKGKNGRNKKASFTRNHKMAAAVAAAAIVAVAFTTGSAVGVYAEQNGGFFQFLQNDEKRVEFITSPEVLEAQPTEGSVNVYNSLEQVPEEYWEDVVTVKDLKLLEGYELQRVEVMETKYILGISSYFYDLFSGEALSIGCKRYSEDVSFSSQFHGNYELINSISEGAIQLDILCRQETDKQEYAVFFFFDNIQYSIQGDGEQEYMENIAREYVKLLKNNFVKK